MPKVILPEVVRQHAEMAAFLWTIYDYNLLNPGKNPDMDAERLERLIERLDAHLDGLRIAGADGLAIAKERYAANPEAGEIYVMRMLQPPAINLKVADLDVEKVRAYLAAALSGRVKP